MDQNFTNSAGRRVWRRRKADAQPLKSRAPPHVSDFTPLFSAPEQGAIIGIAGNNWQFTRRHTGGRRGCREGEAEGRRWAVGGGRQTQRRRQRQRRVGERQIDKPCRISPFACSGSYLVIFEWHIWECQINSVETAERSALCCACARNGSSCVCGSKSSYFRGRLTSRERQGVGVVGNILFTVFDCLCGSLSGPIIKHWPTRSPAVKHRAGVMYVLVTKAPPNEDESQFAPCLPRKHLHVWLHYQTRWEILM